MAGKTKTSIFRSSKSGQVWMLDATISLVLFSAAAIMAFSIITNMISANPEYDNMKKDAAKISDYLLSDGIPENWNATNVIRLGIATSNRINETKAAMAMNLSNESYSAIKPILQTKYDFLVTLEQPDGDLVEVQGFCAIGSPDVAILKNETPPIDCHAVNLSSINYVDMVRVDRFAVFNSDIVRMVVYVWR